MSNQIKPVVFANPVRDLTLARYLAAMEVDFIGIDLDEPDINKTKLFIEQIRNWIEGPKLIGVSSTPALNIAETFSLDGYYLDAEIELPMDAIIFQSRNYFLNKTDSRPSYIIIDNPLDIIETENCILKTSIYVDLVKQTNLSGFMISPGSEEKIGMYDFEQLDQWFGKINK